MRLITWNVAGRVGKQSDQAAAIAGVNADVVCLQEVTLRTAPLWREALAAAGFAAVETALDGLPPKPTKRRLAVLTAARAAVTRLPAPDDLPWPERVLCCEVEGVEIVNVHSPIAPSPELAKIRTHEAVAAHLREPSARPRVLCGDLNTPRRELEDGTLLTFAHDTHGRLRPERGERWDLAERALVRDLGWTDAWRALHGYGTRDASWTFKDDRGGWRLDHVLLDGLEPVASVYCHEWRRAGLSDHSALLVDVQPPAATTS
ncbi:endonuclease/exonuclease/phosphatase family protein [Solirubrobacter sp. CPCC 204708]|uniref:Endonuclease/exonuclease/phosphatase family protein n=1 Tax=Solirubrobacter deserti TaxID=2282478 RepID=A0ABT4REF6_9ACTN|nr:endonuclease/exonuclease/phosphatase family protein [Solirubrobacter deserti]MBE2316170.1 endonuclease/exonuclease/phosphatase family protein [Solirubrobacter deserti]MDA0136919.1 endonuclease/exonuclease/phosphatase family protein [Solirubrobacter deserti]